MVLENCRELRIPVGLRIGVTGQRSLDDVPLLRDSLRQVLARLDRILRHTEHRFIAVASISEGSDRLLAREVLDWPYTGTASSELHIIIPDTIEGALNICTTSASRGECEEFLQRATEVRSIGSVNPGEDKCVALGHEIVRSCDLLVAIWDGRPAVSRGGAGEMVKYARMVGRSLFWIHKDSGKITEERHSDGILESLEYLDVFNAEGIDISEVSERCRRRCSNLSTRAEVLGLPSDLVRYLRPTLLPHLEQALILTKRYERRYLCSGSAVYALAAAATATVTLQVLFFAAYPWLIWLEVAEMATILLLIMLSRVCDWHRKWIDYRFLSGRLRSAIFLSLFCLDPDDTPSVHDPGLLDSANDWIGITFQEIMKGCPLESCRLDLPFEPVKNFLLTAWIDREIAFYVSNSQLNHKRSDLLWRVGEGLFAMTLVFAAVHAMGIMHGEHFPDSLIIALTIILPAVGAALGGIRTKREYLRSSVSYAHMVRNMSVIGHRIRNAKDMSELLGCLREANEAILREQQDRRDVFSFRELETP